MSDSTDEVLLLSFLLLHFQANVLLEPGRTGFVLPQVACAVSVSVHSAEVPSSLGKSHCCSFLA